MSATHSYQPDALPGHIASSHAIGDRQMTLLNIVARVREFWEQDAIFTAAVAEMRQCLSADRVMIVRFDADSHACVGEVVSEAVDAEFISALAINRGDRTVGDALVAFHHADFHPKEFHSKEPIQVFEDIDQIGIHQSSIHQSNIHQSSHHIRSENSTLHTLQQLQVKACVCVPLHYGKRLWGSLNVHQCAASRQWQPDETGFIQQVALHLEIVIQQSELLDQRQLQQVETQRVEQRLRDLQHRLSFLTDHNPVAIIEWNTAFEVVSWNAAATEIFGFTKAEAIGRHATELIVPGHVGDEVDRVFETLLCQTGGARNTNENCTKDGRTIVCEWYNTPSINVDGEVVGVTSMAVDITGQLQTQRSLRQYADKIADLYNNSPCGYHSIDEDGLFTQINDTELRWLGYTREAIVGKMRFVDLLTPASQHLFQQNFSTFKERGWVNDLEYEMIRADGSIMPVSLSATAVRDADGNYLMSRSTVFDITERKRAEQQLHASQQFLGTVINSIPDPVFVKDEQHRWILVNDALAECIGRTKDELIGKSDYDFFTKAEADRFWQKDDVVLATGTESTSQELLTDANGNIHIVSTKKTRAEDAVGNKLIIGVIRDITEYVQVQDELKQARDDLERKVLERTAELQQIVARLQQEIDDRKQAETERNQVEEALRQSEAQLREKAQREQLLNRLASQIRSSLDLNHILRTAVHAIRHLLEIDRCAFLWYRPNAEQPYWEIVQDARNSNLPNMTGSQIDAAEIFPITEKCLNKRLIRIDDVAALADSSARQHFMARNYAAVLGLPIHTQSGEIGVVSCSHSAGARPWQNDEVELLQVVADNLAIAIDQAELYKQSRITAELAQQQAQKLEHTLQDLQHAQAQMIQSEKMSSLGQLVAGVAHEINNPVNFIYGNLKHANDYTQDLLNLLKLYQHHYPIPVEAIQQEAEAIDLDFLVEDLPKLLTSMRVGADRIQRIIASLRTFSRMDEAEFKAVDIHDGIDSTLMILQNRLKAKPDRVAIEVIKEYGNLPLVECYAGQLNQVFMNILSNAIDALEDEMGHKLECSGESSTTPDRVTPCIQIRTQKKYGDRILIHIADNGPGMPESVKRRIFDPFFTTKAVGKGTGMGMSISYQIVTEKHRGSLQCISSPGKGAEFIIEIPIQQ